MTPCKKGSWSGTGKGSCRKFGQGGLRQEIIQKQRTTAPTKGGLFAIDDTGRPKPFAKKTEGAKWQYCSPLKREEVCYAGVGAAFVSQAKRFPLDIIPYLPASEFPRGVKNPQFKDMIQIAIELFGLYAESFGFSGTVFDSWYATARFLKHIYEKDKTFYSEMKSNRNIFMYHPAKKYTAASNQMISLPSSKNITGIKSNTLHSKLRMALKFHIKPIRLRQS
ncbi:MAG: transposase [Candidatus Brocadia sinica]|nr:transposase [Candidatus Brocadia sinica]